MALDNLVHYREPQSRALARFFCGEKGVENLFLELMRNARARIGDLYFNIGLLALGDNGEHSLVRHSVASIGEEIQEHLLHLAFIAREHRILVKPLHDLDAGRPSLVFEEAQRTDNNVVYAGKRESRHFFPRKIEQIVDDFTA